MGTPHQELTFPIVEHEGGSGEGPWSAPRSSGIQSRGGATPVKGVLQNKEEKLPNFRYSPSTGLTRNWTPSKSGRPDNLLAAEILGRGEAFRSLGRRIRTVDPRKGTPQSPLTYPYSIRI
jgi:hypothetical protein